MTVQRVSMITLGVADLDAARGFYERWGWQVRQATPQIVFFQMGTLVLGLFPLPALAEDQGRADAVATLGMGGVTLAQNYATEHEVDERFQAAIAAGATHLKAPTAAPWGGYSGYFADPDGHVWELAVNPYWELGDDGATHIPEDLPAQ
ncbi:VOC family protein [Demequina sp. B12]|uniref:VOC family protein n=1 Tax=Demequina sp. B12 TaxID=2992757 RepID=UPI00237AF361|nr:VOC family protein [Demequina sp. B12]MDE0572880.1 VOC family protein [Demequina sp. B12]